MARADARMLPAAGHPRTARCIGLGLQSPGTRTIATVSALQTHLLLAEFSDPERERQGLPPLEIQSLQRLSTHLAGFGGEQLGSQPRHLLVAFPSAGNALAGANWLRKEMLAGNSGVEIRLLIGSGEVEREGDRLRGSWVHQLGGLVTRLPAGGIGLLAPTVAALPEPRPGLLKLSENLLMVAGSAAKGEASDDATRHSPLRGRSGPAYPELQLRVAGRNRVLRHADCPAIVGRGADCNITVNAPLASRVHGRIEVQDGRFYYLDDSRNGSWVLGSSGDEVRLHHERTVLIGDGAISLGQPISAQTGEVLRYSCRPVTLKLARESDDGTRIL